MRFYQGQKILFFSLLGLFLLAGITGLLYGAGLAAWTHFYPRENQLIALDVGQGDSILIRTAGGRNVLIDGGPDNSVVYRLGRYIPFFDRQIDLVVLTHPEADHVTGLVEVLRRYRVERIWATGVLHTLPAYQAFWEEVRLQGILVESARRGRTVEIQGLFLEVLWPEDKIWGNEFLEGLNKTSVVIKASFGKRKALLSGDLPKEEEALLVERYGGALRSGLLKVGHHGSKTSTSLLFLDAVRPQWGVISVGKDNRFGHPHYRVLRNLARAQVRVVRTDEEGDVGFFAREGGWVRKEGKD